MTERDPKVSAHYRELPREEPPPHVDDAILIAARRGKGRKSRRSYYAIALAAVIVLAIAITVHLERRQDLEVASAPQAQAPSRERSASQQGKREDAPLADLHRAPAPAAPAAEQAASARAETRSALGALAASPEQWLQGIADLRRQGRHEEAERQLEDFRKRYPDYRIPPEILERLKKR